MALTAEQQAEIELQEARDAGRRAHELAMEQTRARAEAIRLAKETLIENDRNKAVGERGVTAEDITAFAGTLVGFVNNN
jgi:Tfp pilus assembly protein FimT